MRVWAARGRGGGGQCASAGKDARETVLGKELGVFTREQGGLEPQEAGVRPEGDGEPVGAGRGDGGAGCGGGVGRGPAGGGKRGWGEGLRGGYFKE